jgi:di- and tripeptidase/Cys-Gly metallodipeptidase DUG1
VSDHPAESAAAESPCWCPARFGPTRFSVIPKVAVGKISLRFVPEQDHGALIDCLQHHVDCKFNTLWSANKVELQVRGGAGRGGARRGLQHC